MASYIGKFKRKVIGSEGRISDYIPKIIAKGDFKRINDLQVILNSWNNILMTTKGSYLLDPDYGSDIYKYIFEPADSKTVEGIQKETVGVLRLYDSRARIVDVSVTGLLNKKGYSIDIVAEYNGVSGSTSVIFDDTTFADFLTRTQE
jgi:phage baseplate assembly protein W